MSHARSQRDLTAGSECQDQMRSEEPGAKQPTVRLRPRPRHSVCHSQMSTLNQVQPQHQTRRFSLKNIIIIISAVLVFVMMSSALQKLKASAGFMTQPTRPTSDLLLIHATASDLQARLTAGELRSTDLVVACLGQIAKYDGYLHAIISAAPSHLLLARARELDEERKAGKLRSKLHGIPIIIKDNIANKPDMGMGTSAGNYALAESQPKENARVVDHLLAAGLIIIGKASLTELANFKGSGIPSGWSAYGGQGQSAYVRGGLQDNDIPSGHSAPGGSSSGSAIGVSAGYAPISLGTDTQGSIVQPATRAALYSLKPTLGRVSQKGVVPIAHSLDSIGPMAKSPGDVADLLEVISGDFLSSTDDKKHPSTVGAGSWAKIAVGAVEPSLWRADPGGCRPVPDATEQMEREINAACEKIKGLAKSFHAKLPLPERKHLFLNGSSSVDTLIDAEFRAAFNDYLQALDKSPVRSLKELIEYNQAHSDLELPSGRDDQSELINAEENQYTEQEIEKIRNFMRKVGRTEGLDIIFDQYQIDVIIGPADSKISEFANAASYPICTLPLGSLEYNGRPHGMVAIARAGQEATLIKVMRAWESTFPARVVPNLDELDIGETARLA